MSKLWQRWHDGKPGFRYGLQTMFDKKRLLVLLALTMVALPARAELPRGWELFTTSPRLYQAARDTVAAGGKTSGSLQGLPNATPGKYALLLQKISAADYRGRRVTLRAKVQMQGVTGRAGLWIRADDASGEPLVFDNMEDRPIAGDHDWQTLILEVDIPAQAKEIHFGLLLSGAGRARVDDLTLAATDLARPTAGTRSRVRSLPTAPVNGDFER